MATKNNPGQFDCYKNAEPDEPLFVLLGRDKHAPTLIWLWSVLRELDGEDASKVAEARACADAMIKWQVDRNKVTAGIGQSVLAGVLELIRTANYSVQHVGPGKGASEALARLILGKTEFSKPE